MNPTTDHSLRSWILRVKALAAGVAIAALALFGAVGADAPEPADHEAGATWSFHDAPSDDLRGKGPGGGAGTFGATWS